MKKCPIKIKQILRIDMHLGRESESLLMMNHGARSSCVQREVVGMMARGDEDWRVGVVTWPREAA